MVFQRRSQTGPNSDESGYPFPNLKMIDHSHTGSGEFAHSRQQQRRLFERNSVADHHGGIQLPVLNHLQHSAVFERLHAVTAKNLQLISDHGPHRNRRICFTPKHQAHLNMTPAFSE